jgi:hypothetical protein
MSDKPRKTIYHNELRTPTTVTVKSDALVSKYHKTEDEPGHLYVFLEIAGTDRSYFSENDDCGKWLGERKGKTLTIKAVESGAVGHFVEVDATAGNPEEAEPVAERPYEETAKKEAPSAKDQAVLDFIKDQQAVWHRLEKRFSAVL